MGLSTWSRSASKITGDHRQRGAQVVGDIGGHLLAQPGGARQVGAHTVELAGQPAQLIARAHRHLLRQVAAGDPLGGGG